MQGLFLSDTVQRRSATAAEDAGLQQVPVQVG